MSKKNKANKSKPGVVPGAHAKMLLSAVRNGSPIRRGPMPTEISYFDMLGLLRDLNQHPTEPVNEHLPLGYVASLHGAGYDAATIEARQYLLAKQFEMDTQPRKWNGPIPPAPQTPLPATPSKAPDWRVEVGFSEARPSPYDLAPWQAAILKRTMEQTKPRDEFHRRAQKAEGASKYLWKSMRRYQDMLAKAYYLIGIEIGRGNRFVVDPVPLIKDAPLMNAFKNALHRGYRDGENLSPELRILDHDRIRLTPAGEGN